MSASETKDAPAFDFFGERWSHGTRHMTKVERSDYLDLLIFQWTEQGLPGDMNAVARIIGYRKASQIPAVVLEKFPLHPDGKRRNARLEVIRQEQRERIRKRREQRKAAAEARWHRGRSGEDAVGMRPDDPRKCDADATALRAQCPPPTAHHPPESPTGDSPPDPQGGTEGKKPRPWEPDENQRRINTWFKRRDTTFWSEKEQRAYRANAKATHADDWTLLETYYVAPVSNGRDYRRRDVLSLLNNWQGEIDRARRFASTGEMGGVAPPRDAKGQRPGEIRTDVDISRVKRL